jgi:uncharacterized delta-60 repeat protein
MKTWKQVLTHVPFKTVMLGMAWCFCLNAHADTVSTAAGAGADIEMREQSNSGFDTVAMNTRTSINGDRNEIIGLRFDLSGYTLGYLNLTNVSLRLTSFRDDSYTRVVDLYGVAQGTTGSTGSLTTENWDETALTAFGDLPGLLATDTNYLSQSINLGSVTHLGRITVTGAVEGATQVFNDLALTAFIQGYTGSDRVTFLLAAGGTSTGQFRVASKEATNLATTGLFTGPAGTFAPALSFSVTAPCSNCPPFIGVQPADESVTVTETAAFQVIAFGTAPLSYLWRFNGSTLEEATNATLTLTAVTTNQAGNYTVVVTNRYGSVTSTVAQLTVNLATLDSGFNPGADDVVYCLAEQPDGKILVGGNFTTLGGQARNCLGRLNSDGTLDTPFNPGASSSVYALAQQPDGKILVGGAFTTLAGQARNCIGWLNNDGTLDTTFNPGANSDVRSLAVQADGKILVGGTFTTLGGQPRDYIGRLNADGTLDTAFNPGAGGNVYSLAVQADGKILVGGNFMMLGGQMRYYVGRLNSDGTLDTTFNPGANASVYCLAQQADGKILVGGNFTMLGGQTRNYVGRLNSDGRLDPTFNPGANSHVRSLALQADGQIVVGGYFTTLGGQTRNYLGRLNSDGRLDPTFNPGASSYVYSLALQGDGKILAGGYFTTLSEQTRSRIGRLNNTGPATQSLTYDGSTVTWLRGGTSPEVWRTTFDVSTNGTDWLSLGAGTRVAGLTAGQAGGWQWINVSLSAGTTLRARGFVTGGRHNVSSWFVETRPVASPPLLVTEPASITNNVGTEATFSVVVGGTPPFSYQWRKDGTNLPGDTCANLSLTNVQESRGGLYSVVVSNVFGSMTSSSALLVVNQAPIADASATQPLVISGNGTDAGVILNGTRSSDPDGEPLTYAWYEAGQSVPSGSGVVAVLVLPVGPHPILLVVSDGMLSASNAVTVEVITTAQAVERLIAQVTAVWPRSQPLLAPLSATLASIERGNCISAVNQLMAFQNEVRAQVAPSDPALAASFTQGAQEVIDVLSGGHANSGGRPHGRLTVTRHQSNGRVQLGFAAERGVIYTLGASTNLVSWETIGIAVDHGDGTFEFEDPNAARFLNRFYRIVSP